MNLYSIHCGFYDEEISEGIYEFHVNIPVAAQTIEDAKTLVRSNPVFQRKKMHIDGIQEIKSVCGYRIELALDGNHLGRTQIDNYLHRDL